MNLKKWKNYLESMDYSNKTIDCYYEALVCFSKQFKTMNFKNLKAFKEYLIKEGYSIQTINLRLLALNKYCKWLGHPEWKVKALKSNKNTFLDNVLTKDEFKRLCRNPKKDNIDLYFLIKFIACTGARKSEILRFTVDDVKLGYVDLLCKGGKSRRIYIPSKLKKEALTYKTSGLLFEMKYSYILKQLKDYASKYNLSPKAMKPHAFRHFYALSFIENCQDISLLADLLGHSNVETTRIYLKRTSSQQASLINKIVTW